VLLCMSRVDVVGKRMLLTELFSPSTRIRSFRATVSSVNAINLNSVSSFRVSTFPLMSWVFMHLRWSAVLEDVMQFVFDQELHHLSTVMLET
jgi:hypothetical protein